MDSTHLTGKDQLRRSVQVQPGPTPTLVWTTLLKALAGRPLDVRPSGQPAAAFHPSFGCSPPHQVLRRSSEQGVKYLYIFHSRVPFPTVVQPQMGMQNTGIGRGWSPHCY